MTLKVFTVNRVYGYKTALYIYPNHPLYSATVLEVRRFIEVKEPDVFFEIKDEGELKIDILFFLKDISVVEEGLYQEILENNEVTDDGNWFHNFTIGPTMFKPYSY